MVDLTSRSVSSGVSVADCRERSSPVIRTLAGDPTLMCRSDAPDCTTACRYGRISSNIGGLPFGCITRSGRLYVGRFCSFLKCWRRLQIRRRCVFVARWWLLKTMVVNEDDGGY